MKKLMNGKTNRDKYKAVNIGLAVLLTIRSFVIIYTTLGIIYQTNDDAQLANIAAGGYGDWLHMIYVNMVFSVLLRPLYAIYYANWYVIIQLVLVLISIAVSAYIIMKKVGTLPGLVMMSALLVSFSEHIFYSFQYTEISFITIAAGLLVVADNLGEWNYKTFFGIILTAFGTMVRWDSFYAVGGMSSVILLYSFFKLSTDKKKKAFLSMSVLFAVVFGLKAVDTLGYRLDREWNEFVQYNSARTRYSDYRVFSLPEENPFENEGISDIDYIILNSWNYYDKYRFDTDLLNELADYTRPITIAQLIDETKHSIENMITGKSYNYMLFAVVLFSVCQLRPRTSAFTMIGVYSVFIALIVYLTYRVRFPSWVMSGLIWALAIFIFYCTGEIRPNKIFVFVTAMVMLVYVADITYPGYKRMIIKSGEYHAAVRNGYEYIDHMSQDKENLYLLSTASALECAGMDITTPRTDNYFSNIVTYGDWLSRAPHREKVLERYNVKRPIVDAVDNPNVYVDAKSIDIAVRYAQQELGVEVFAIKTGSNEYAPYQLITKIQ